MSLILDALRKSERSRQHSLSVQVGTVETPPARTHLPVPWSTLIGLLLIVNAAVLTVVYWHGSAPPVAAPAPAAAYRPEVRPLAEEAAQTEAAAAPAAAASADIKPPVTAAANPAPAAENLSNQVPASLPPLHLDVHGYASKPADRFVVINLHRYQVGDTLAEGPKVVDIVPQGVVLEYQGSTFLLPRP